MIVSRAIAGFSFWVQIPYSFIRSQVQVIQELKVRKRSDLTAMKPRTSKPKKIMVTDQAPGELAIVTKESQLVTDAVKQPGKGVTIANRYGEKIDVAYWMGRALKSIQAVVSQHEKLSEELYWLEKCSRINAQPYWREGKYLYLIYPQVNGERQRAYIGCNRADVDRVLKAMENHRKFEALKKQIEEIERSLQSWVKEVEMLEFAARSYEREFVGDKSELPAGQE